MTLSGDVRFNGLYIKNNNLLLDPANVLISDTDWTFQFYYKAPQFDINVRLFYVSDDSFGIYISQIDRKLYLYVNKSIGRVDIPLDILVDDIFTCYTFVKSGNNFKCFVNGVLSIELIDVFVGVIYSTDVDYLCIGSTQPSKICSVNFIAFWSIALLDSFINNYFQFIYPNSFQNLLINIRSGVDYSNNNLTVELDPTNSSIISYDVCSDNGG